MRSSGGGRVGGRRQGRKGPTQGGRVGAAARDRSARGPRGGAASGGITGSAQACAEEVLGAPGQGNRQEAQEAGRGLRVTPWAGNPAPPHQRPWAHPHPGRIRALGSGAGEAHHTLPWAHQSRPHSRPLRHTSSARGCSGRSPCSGTHPPRRSSGLQEGGNAQECAAGWAWAGVGTEGSQGAPGAPGTRLLTAVGRLVTAVHTVIVPVTDPDAGDAALGDGALELVGGTGHLGCGAGTE